MSDPQELLAPEAIAPALPAASPRHWPRAAWAGLGSCLAILLLQAVGQGLQQPLLLAPFGASCVLLFVAPDSPLAQPRNVVLGYALATLVGFAALWLFPGAWWAVALAVGATISLMALFHCVHPPAGAHPIVILMGGTAWKMLLPTLAIGLGLLLLSAWLFHRLWSPARA